MGRCVIIGGANIEKYDTVKQYFNKDDFIIYCDCGLKHRSNLCVEPNLIIGDFDSYKRYETSTETIVLPCEKDDTDTAYAIKEALKRGYKNFLLIGMIGQRLDHTMGNISLLMMLYNNGAKGIIVDDYSEISLIVDSAEYIENSFSYFSVITVGEKAVGVDIENAKYELKNATINYDFQYGISNETLPNIKAKVSVKNGKLLLIKTR